MGFKVLTKNGHDFWEMLSLLQKAIRRNDYKNAGAAANELFPKHRNSIWDTIYTVFAEDCFPCSGVGETLIALKQMQDDFTKRGKPGKIFISRAICLVCLCLKNRDAAFYGCNYFHDANHPELEENREQDFETIPLTSIPPWTFDVHTLKGKMAGKTIWDMIESEQAALTPLQKGLFDDDKEWSGFKNRIKVLGK